MSEEQHGVLLLTGDQRRHAWVSRRLSRALPLVGVVSETKRHEQAAAKPHGDSETAVMARHLAMRDEVECELLGESLDFANVPRLEVPLGGSNAPEVYEWIRQKRPKWVILYGTSIIRPPLLDAFPDHMVNIHLGLSPYYRGSATNFWPLVDGLPECVGVTVHLAVQKVDAGSILGQVRPEVTATDNAHHLGTRALMAGVALLPQLLDGLEGRQYEPSGQSLAGGKVCRTKDFSAESVRQLWAHLKQGLMSRYVSEKGARDAAYPIVERK